MSFSVQPLYSGCSCFRTTICIFRGCWHGKEHFRQCLYSALTDRWLNGIDRLQSQKSTQQNVLSVYIWGYTVLMTIGHYLLPRVCFPCIVSSGCWLLFIWEANILSLYRASRSYWLIRGMIGVGLGNFSWRASFVIIFTAGLFHLQKHQATFGKF